jgi:hypothetical protein
MKAYVDRIITSELPIPLWVVAALWLVVFGCSIFLALHARRLAGVQSHVAVSDMAHPDLSPQRLAVQVVVTCGVLLIAHLLGGAGEAFFAGGWLITAAAALAVNLRNYLSLRRLGSEGVVSGKIELSAAYSLQDLSYGFAASALLFLVVAVLVAHSAAFGAAWLLGANSLSYRKRAHAARGA